MERRSERAGRADADPRRAVDRRVPRQRRAGGARRPHSRREASPLRRVRRGRRAASPGRRRSDHPAGGRRESSRVARGVLPGRYSAALVWFAFSEIAGSPRSALTPSRGRNGGIASNCRSRGSEPQTGEQQEDEMPAQTTCRYCSEVFSNKELLDEHVLENHTEEVERRLHRGSEAEPDRRSGRSGRVQRSLQEARPLDRQPRNAYRRLIPAAVERLPARFATSNSRHRAGP